VQLDALIPHPLLHLQPGDIAARVDVLQPKVPGLAQPDGATHQIEQILAGGARLQFELQLRVEGAHPHGEGAVLLGAEGAHRAYVM